MFYFRLLLAGSSGRKHSSNRPPDSNWPATACWPQTQDNNWAADQQLQLLQLKLQLQYSRRHFPGNSKSEMTTTTTATATTTTTTRRITTCNVVGHLINKWPNANEIDRNSPKEYIACACRAPDGGQGRARNGEAASNWQLGLLETEPK